MKLSECNPFVRTTEIQPAILEGCGLRKAYDYRIFYVLSGSGKFITKDETVELSPKSLIYLAPSIGYTFDGKMKVIVINFDVTRNASEKRKPICPPQQAYFNKMNVFDDTVIDELGTKVIIDNGLFYEKDLLNLLECFLSSNQFSDALTSAILKNILSHIAINISTTVNSEVALAEKIYSYIRLNSSTIKSNDDIASVLGYHPVYLGTVFKKITGKNLHYAIFEERIRLSCKWLTQTTRSIEDIAISTGFSSRSHFCTVFKEYTGVSPLKYRANQLHNN